MMLHKAPRLCASGDKAEKYAVTCQWQVYMRIQAQFIQKNFMVLSYNYASLRIGMEHVILLQYFYRISVSRLVCIYGIHIVPSGSIKLKIFVEAKAHSVHRTNLPRLPSL
jgi:hypothetical protein